ncbi:MULTISPECIES: hypothetical protein [Achromobacter]|uniref:hypothetical protein n=1 Tax=Achromobacter TaxID=222 RepID=UPI001467BA32|nr:MULTISPECIES: hypothetical protein [Achromobacter]CAB3819848.1 hypothetical protein LMG3412_00195 [Achromobacter deleyi]
MIPRQERSRSASFDRPAPSQAPHAPEMVSLTVRIDTLDALKVRLALHRELGERIGVYVLSVDHAHGQSVLQLHCAQDQVDALMHAVMCGLPQAEFGPLRRAAAVTVQ